MSRVAPAQQPGAASRQATLAMAGAGLLFAVMALVARRAALRLPGAEVAFVRFVVGLAGCALAALGRGLRPRNWRGLIARGCFGGLAVLCYFQTIAHLSAGLATLLNYTAPIFTALFAALFPIVDGEPLSGRTLGALATTSLGVLLVIYGDAPPGSLGFGPWQLVGILGAVFSGAAVAAIRVVRRTDGSWEVFASFCLFGALITGGPAARWWVPPSPREWLLLGVVGALALVAQVTMTWSLRWLSATLGGVLMQVTPVASIALGWLFLGERTAGLALLGAALTLAGVTWGAVLASPRQ